MQQPQDLPADVESLQQVVLSLRGYVSQLEHNLRLLKQQVYGRSSERRTTDSPNGSTQGHLFLQEFLAEAARMAEQHQSAATVTIPAHERKQPGRRKEFPDHLPVVRTTCELKPEQRSCACGGELKEFGEETSRELERVEVSVVHETVRKKYTCTTCQQGVVTAPWRGRVIEKGLLGPGFLAHLITERFGHHMPYYRLESKYKSERLDLSRSVLCESMARCAELLEPIAEELRREVVASEVLFTDDTPVLVARSSEGGPREARVWVYLNAAGRHWYDFTKTRKRDGPARVLGEFEGYIQADAYSGYDQIFLPGRAIEVAFRVGGDVAVPTPHRSGRARFTHPVPHESGSLATA